MTSCSAVLNPTSAPAPTHPPTHPHNSHSMLQSGPMGTHQVSQVFSIGLICCDLVPCSHAPAGRSAVALNTQRASSEYGWLRGLERPC